MQPAIRAFWVFTSFVAAYFHRDEVDEIHVAAKLARKPPERLNHVEERRDREIGSSVRERTDAGCVAITVLKVLFLHLVRRHVRVLAQRELRANPNVAEHPLAEKALA